jgi:hypothetical protein
METLKTTDDKKVQQQDVEHARAEDDTSSLGKGDILQLEHTDPILNAKMHLVNNAIDEVCPSLPTYPLLLLMHKVHQHLTSEH